MQQYEYKIVNIYQFRIREDGTHEYEDYLNEMGKQGWQPKRSDHLTGDTFLVMERKIDAVDVGETQ